MGNPWFAFYADDYDRDTADLNFVQDSAYGRLIRHYYRCGGPLPANAEQLHRICRAFADAEKEAIDYCLRRYFHEEQDGWHHNRCDEEIAKSRIISEKRSKSALSRYSKCNANAEQLHTQLQPQLHIDTTPPISPSQKFKVPEWVPGGPWRDYELMRTKKRKPLTDRAREMAVATLEKLRSQGQNVEAVINQSVFHSWDKFYEVHEDSSGANQSARVERHSKQAQRINSNRETLTAALRARHPGMPMDGQTGSGGERGSTGLGQDERVDGGVVVIPPRRY